MSQVRVQGVSLFTGLDYWTDLFATKNHFMPCNQPHLPALYNQSVSIITQVTSSWHLHGVWLSTLNSGCQQVAVACSAATYQCMQRSITSNPKISGNKVIEVEASINVKGQLYGYFSITQYLSIDSQPHPFDTAWALDSKRLCFTG